MGASSRPEGEALALAGYLAAPGFEARLRAELGVVTAEYGRLLIAPGPPRDAIWAANVWLDPVRVRIDSIADAARQLRARQRNWAAYSFRLHRRSALIAEALPHVSARPLRFPAPGPRAPLGSFVLLEPDVLLASAECSSPFRHGEAVFVEDRTAPPSRAYLKLWEALTLLGCHPEPGESCLDAGASPGGWTWVLAQLGARVLAVDRAPLDPRIAGLPGVESRRGNALDVLPVGGTRFDWIFCDAASPPDKLLAWVRTWLESGCCSNFICTLKLQEGRGDAALRGFASLPGGRLRHLWTNKHEVTWMCALAPGHAPASGAGPAVKRDRLGRVRADAS